MRLSFKRIAIIFLIGLFGFFNFLNFQVKAADNANTIQNKLDKYQNKAEDVAKDLQQSQGLLQKTTSQVITTQSLIEKTGSEIARKEAEVNNLNARLELNRKILSEYVRQAYYDNEQSLVIQLALQDNNLSGILGNLSQSLGVKDHILNLLEEIKKSKGELEKNKNELADKKEEHEKLLNIQKNEQAAFRQDVQEAQITLNQLNAKIAELKSALSSFLGKSYSTKDIDDAVKFASKATGIRKEFLQAELIVETGYGTFTGGCKYDDTKNLRMRAADKNEFLKIAAALEKAYGGNYKNKKLSCTPKRNGKFFGYGGAMGIAQFMPTTWIGYKSKISAKTGSTPADPWDLADGITGMAIKLANGGATSKSGEVGASMLYYCGSKNPSSSATKTACRNYASKVQKFSKDPESYM